MEYTSPGEALSSGLRSGLGLAAQYQQIQQQREEAAFKRQLETAEIGMKLTENKNLPLDQRVSAFNKGVRPVLTRLGIPMPEMNATSAKSDAFQDAVKNSSALMDQMRAGKIDPHAGMNAIVGHFTGALKDMSAETESEKTQRELITSNAKSYVEEADKAKGKQSDKTPTPAEAIRRQTELDHEMASLNKIGTAEEQIGIAELKKVYPNIEPGKVDPAMVANFKNGIRREKSLLNEYIPDKYRSKETINMAEFKQMRAAGVSMDDLHKDFKITDAPKGMDPLQLYGTHKQTVMPLLSPAPAVPMRAPMAAPPAPGGTPAAPPPLAMPAPMAAPAPVPLPTAGPLTLSGGAVKPTETGPLQLQNQSLQ